MARLTTPKAEIDLPQAFRLLGKGPPREKLGWVADRLRESGVEVDYGDALVELALASGSSAFVALDLAVVRYSGLEALTRGAPRTVTDHS